MKIAIIGNGNVGLATFRELQGISGIREICLIGRNNDKNRAEIEDYKDAFVLRQHPCPAINCGGYEKTKDADIIIYASGVGQKPGQSRLDLVEENIRITDEIFAQVNQYNRQSIVIVLSNPVDIVTREIVKVTGRDRFRVFGTGTLLDSARCTRYLSNLLDLSSKSVETMVIGEHGDSSVFLESSLRILGMSLDEYLSYDIGEEVNSDKELIIKNVRATAGKLIKDKGYTAYGVAAAAARLVTAIIQDEKAILPVSVLLNGEYETDDVSISVPCTIGRNGIIRIMPLSMSDEEKTHFLESAQKLHETQESLIKKTQD